MCPVQRLNIIFGGRVVVQALWNKIKNLVGLILIQENDRICSIITCTNAIAYSFTSFVSPDQNNIMQ